ncbi:MAG: FIST C-terminal domain-containing protein [Gammaproteobacteria bacterium]|nr:FIST C-terminal domain-containing protein [Gammaproteobacteria bacterium]NNJ51021.1 histidine kinase [Gammaproteobacteria bacterium]
MDKFFSISSQQDTPQAVISDCLQQIDSAPAEANFGFIYVTDAMTADLSDLLNRCKAVTGIEHWVGSIGLGIISTGQEIYDSPAASIMLANFADDTFSMVPLIAKQQDIATLLQWPREFATNFGIIHGDPLNPDTQDIIESLQQQLENGFIVGGLTSARGEHLQITDEVTSGGISGVLFSENVGVITNLSQGCSPVGEKHRIDKAQENVAFLLDKDPALQVLMQDMDLDSYQQLQEAAAEVFIGLCISGSDRSDYTVRNLVGIDTDHDIFAINDYLTEGNEIIFCKRNKQTAIDDMQHMLDNLAARLKKKPRGGLYVSCLGRGRGQFGNDSEEIKMIQDTLGDFPLTGFFANGEIHHNKLYGYTGVLTLFT